MPGDPIDILAIAASRLHDARVALLAANMMQAGPGAEYACAAARIDFRLALEDMDAIKRVAREIRGMTAPDLTTACPNCGHQKASDLIGHRRTGTQCYWCGHSTDRDPDPKAAHPATLPPGSRSVDPADTGVGRSYGDATTLDGALHQAGGVEGR